MLLERLREFFPPVPTLSPDRLCSRLRDLPLSSLRGLAPFFTSRKSGRFSSLSARFSDLFSAGFTIDCKAGGSDGDLAGALIGDLGLTADELV